MPNIHNKDFIKEKLIREGYNDKMADAVASELVQVGGSLTPLVEKWVNDGKTVDFESHGYSITGLMKSRGMTYPAALLTIDWLIKQPEIALRSLKRGIR